MSCPRCREGAILLGEPKGSIETGFLGNSYLSPAPSTSSKKAVLIFTDAFGLDIPNPKLIADELSIHLQCDVWVPDYFLGKPVAPADSMVTGDPADVKMTLWQWIKFLFESMQHIGSMWGNRPARLDPLLEEFILKLKEAKKYERIGAVGYCYGGATAIRFASRPDLLDTVVICHPAKFTFQSLFSVKDIRNFKIPSSWVCAEADTWFSASLRDRCEAELASRKGKDGFSEYEFRVYKGTTHGFATRPHLELPEVKTAFEGALAQKVEWLKKTL